MYRRFLLFVCGPIFEGAARKIGKKYAHERICFLMIPEMEKSEKKMDQFFPSFSKDLLCFCSQICPLFVFCFFSG
jgi:ATP-dependent protease Clp ATPase subunit